MSEATGTRSPAGGEAREERGTARAPTQTRGRVRVDAILDAAAAIIVEEGLPALTMHGIARRAATSIGSLYHFFPDRDGVLQGLIERHEMAIHAINAEQAKIAPEVWCALPVADAVGRLIAPYVEHVRQNPDFFPLMHGRRSKANEANFIEGLERMLDARLPELLPAVLELYASMLHAVAAGTMQFALTLDPDQMDFYLKEVQRVMAAYLAEIECAVRG